MLRISRSISLVIAALLLALSIQYLFEAKRKGDLVEDGAGLMTEAERGFMTRYHDKLLAGENGGDKLVHGSGGISQLRAA